MDAARARTETDEKAPRRHIVVYSSGRSGSNRLLDIFDQHELTNCRNEIDVCDPVFDAFCTEADLRLSEPLAARWSALVQRSTFRKGDRDRFQLSHKRYLRDFPARLWGAAMRRRLRRHVLRIASDDWAIPGVILHPRAQADIVPVFKVSRPQRFLAATHAAMPAQTVVHNIREPEKYLNSWYNRLVVPEYNGDLEAVYRLNRATAQEELRRNGMDVKLDEAFSLRALLVAELWNWRLCNEPIHEALRGSPRYRLVHYNEISTAPEETARRLFMHAGLEFTAMHAARIAALRNTLFASPHAARLDPVAVQEAADEVLSDCPVCRFAQDQAFHAPHDAGPGARGLP